MGHFTDTTYSNGAVLITRIQDLLAQINEAVATLNIPEEIAAQLQDALTTALDSYTAALTQGVEAAQVARDAAVIAAQDAQTALINAQIAAGAALLSETQAALSATKAELARMMADDALANIMFSNAGSLIYPASAPWTEAELPAGVSTVDRALAVDSLTGIQRIWAWSGSAWLPTDLLTLAPSNLRVGQVTDVRNLPAGLRSIVCESYAGLSPYSSFNLTYNWDPTSTQLDSFDTNGRPYVILPTGHVGAGRYIANRDPRGVNIDDFGCLSNRALGSPTNNNAALANAWNFAASLNLALLVPHTAFHQGYLLTGDLKIGSVGNATFTHQSRPEIVGSKRSTGGLYWTPDAATDTLFQLENVDHWGLRMLNMASNTPGSGTLIQLGGTSANTQATRGTIRDVFMSNAIWGVKAVRSDGIKLHDLMTLNVDIPCDLNYDLLPGGWAISFALDACLFENVVDALKVGNGPNHTFKNSIVQGSSSLNGVRMRGGELTMDNVYFEGMQTSTLAIGQNPGDSIGWFSMRNCRTGPWDEPARIDRVRAIDTAGLVTNEMPLIFGPNMGRKRIPNMRRLGKAEANQGPTGPMDPNLKTQVRQAGVVVRTGSLPAQVVSPATNNWTKLGQVTAFIQNLTPTFQTTSPDGTNPASSRGTQSLRVQCGAGVASGSCRLFMRFHKEAAVGLFERLNARELAVALGLYVPGAAFTVQVGMYANYNHSGGTATSLCLIYTTQAGAMFNNSFNEWVHPTLHHPLHLATDDSGGTNAFGHSAVSLNYVEVRLTFTYTGTSLGSEYLLLDYIALGDGAEFMDNLVDWSVDTHAPLLAPSDIEAKRIHVGQLVGELITLPDGDTAPSVRGLMNVVTNNTTPTPYANFDDGVAGQRLTFVTGDANSSIVHGATIQLHGAANFEPSVANASIEFLRVGAVWVQRGVASVPA